MKFAHIADAHIGALKSTLGEYVIRAFEIAMDMVIQENVDFVLFCGDLLHNPIPDLSLVKRATKKLRDVSDAGIPVYVIPGSHDYSPNVSMLDVWEASGLVKKVVSGKMEHNRLFLDFFVDPKTNAKIAGLSGKKRGKEIEYFMRLDHKKLEEEDGFKIFAFHTAIRELSPDPMESSVPLSCFPKNFNYYAGGHIHQSVIYSHEGYGGPIVYPGPLFAGYPRDLEVSAKGEKRGFYIVSVSPDGEVKPEFREIHLADYCYIECDVNEMSSTKAYKYICSKISSANVRNKIVFLRIKGELASGKTSDIDVNEIRKMLAEKGARDVVINRYGLTTKEYTKIKIKGKNSDEIEKTLFREAARDIRIRVDALKGERGVKLAIELLRKLEQSQQEGEQQQTYLRRIRGEAMDVLKLSEILEEINKLKRGDVR